MGDAGSSLFRLICPLRAGAANSPTLLAFVQISSGGAVPRLFDSLIRRRPVVLRLVVKRRRTSDAHVLEIRDTTSIATCGLTSQGG